jgi:hypothetical protein
MQQSEYVEDWEGVKRFRGKDDSKKQTNELEWCYQYRMTQDAGLRSTQLCVPARKRSSSSCQARYAPHSYTLIHIDHSLLPPFLSPLRTSLFLLPPLTSPDLDRLHRSPKFSKGYGREKGGRKKEGRMKKGRKMDGRMKEGRKKWGRKKGGRKK